MQTIRLFVATVICILIIWITQRTPEPFVVASNEDIAYTNTGNKPWQRHPVNSVATDMVSTYSKAYYYELNNSDYDVAIKKTFQYSCQNALKFVQSHEWKTIPLEEDSAVRTAYQNTITFIGTSLNASKYLKLVGLSTKLQIVHDVLLEAKRHIQRPFTYILTFELIVYREAKYHGKHIRASAYVEYNKNSRSWDVSVIELDVLGVVFEDQIGLHPVIANYPVATTALPYEALEKGATTIIPDAKTTEKIVQKQSQLQRDAAATDKSLSLT